MAPEETTSPSAAGPRLTAKGAATRARIVVAAAELMFSRGVPRTGIEDVQRAAMVSASQLYHYFADRQALVHAVVEHQIDAVLDGQQPLLSHLDSFKALQAWRDLLVAAHRPRHCAGGCVLGSLAGDLAEIDPDARERLATGFAQWQSHLRSGLASMREQGELRAETDPDRLALVLLAAVQGGLLLGQTYRTVGPLEIAVDAALAHVQTFAAATVVLP